MVLTAASLAAATGQPNHAALVWAPVIDLAWREYGIAHPAECAMWIAQCAHETGGFRTLRENLNYSAEALMRVWPRRFAGVADLYHRQPERIANRAYANRMGNGDEASGDGWRYRGGGLIQLTGRENYSRAGAGIGILLGVDPSLIERPDVAVRAACWFWRVNRLGTYARAGNLDACSDLINLGRLTPAVGDANGYADRADRYRRALTVFGY